jgi:hypothetical protein
MGILGLFGCPDNGMKAPHRPSPEQAIAVIQAADSAAATACRTGTRRAKMKQNQESAP